MKSPNQTWFVLNSGPGEAALNMALDAALLESADSLAHPALRFYGWTQPAASFGYFQKYTDVEGMTLLRQLVRRPTGGGLVPHDADWTYSLTVPPTDPWYTLSAVESYRKIHEWIRDALQKLGVATELAEHARKALPGQCFEGYERFDVLWKGKKIAGAAQRRTRSGLLIQGSVQPPPVKISRADWERAMLEVASAIDGIAWSTFKPGAQLTSRTLELAAKTYSQAAHNRRR